MTSIGTVFWGIPLPGVLGPVQRATLRKMPEIVWMQQNQTKHYLAMEGSIQSETSDVDGAVKLRLLEAVMWRALLHTAAYALGVPWEEPGWWLAVPEVE